MLRVERLSEPARELLAARRRRPAARRPLLEETSGLEPRALRDALREAVEGHILVVHDDGLYRFRHALLREVVEDDLLPGERAELHLRARAGARAAPRTTDAQSTAAVAHHFAAAGDRPAALAAAVRAATAAERVHAYGEAAALLDRALELWDRVPDAEALAGVDRVTVLTRAAEAAGALGDPGRQLALLEPALAELGPRPGPAARRADPRGDRPRPAPPQPRRGQHRHARARARAGRRRSARTARAACSPAWRARCMIARPLPRGRRASRARRWRPPIGGGPAADRGARAQHARLLARDDRRRRAGAAELREAIRIAREHDDPSDLAEAYVNYADMLHMLGRSAEARAVAAEGREAVGGPSARRDDVARPASSPRSRSTVGDWEQAEAALPERRAMDRGADARRHRAAAGGAGARPRRPRGGRRAARRARADRRRSRASRRCSARSRVLAAELHRREGDLEAARAAVDDWLERIECCQRRRDARGRRGRRGRDRGGRRRRARPRPRRRRAPSRALGAWTSCSRAWPRRPPPTRPVERAALAGRPRRGRARRRAARTRRPTRGPPRRGRRLGRPEPAARMRWREAEAHAAAGDREAAAEAARAAHAAAARLGAGWLRGEIERLAARARLTLDDRAARTPAEPPGGGRVRAHRARAAGARRCSPRARRTARSARRCSWPRRPPASTSRASSRSSTRAHGPRRPRSRTATVWPTSPTARSR